MRRIYLVAAFACLSFPIQAADIPKNELAKRGKAATFLIETTEGSGSGFCVHASGLVVTNNHVIDNTDETKIWVIVQSGQADEKAYSIKVLRRDAALDLALLQIDAKEAFPALSVGSVDNLVELTEVVAFGFPLGKYLATNKGGNPSITVSSGRVSALRTVDKELAAIQLDAAINPGNSGGPVLDGEGNVIGVVVAGIRGAAAVNFPIPANKLARFLQKPELQVAIPKIEFADRHKPARFAARVLYSMPVKAATQPELELAMKGSDGKERLFKMTPQNGYFDAMAEPVTNGDAKMNVTVTFANGLVQGRITDQLIGAGSVKWSQIRSLHMQPEPHVVLLNEKTLSISAKGLKPVNLLLGEESISVPMVHALEAVVQTGHDNGSVECTVVARLEGKELVRWSQALSFAGMPTAQPASYAGEKVATKVATRRTKAINLVPMIDIQRDVLNGKWAIQGSAIVCESGTFVPRVQIPYQPPEEYNFTVSFMQPRLRNGISLVMPNPKGGAFFWQVGGSNGAEYGFGPKQENGGKQQGLIWANAVHTTTVHVRKDGVKGFVNGKLMVEHKGYDEMKVDNWREVKNQSWLAIACDDPTVFQSVELEEITGSGKKGR